MFPGPLRALLLRSWYFIDSPWYFWSTKQLRNVIFSVRHLYRNCSLVISSTCCLACPGSWGLFSVWFATVLLCNTYNVFFPMWRKTGLHNILNYGLFSVFLTQFHFIVSRTNQGFKPNFCKIHPKYNIFLAFSHFVKTFYKIFCFHGIPFYPFSYFLRW